MPRTANKRTRKTQTLKSLLGKSGLLLLCVYVIFTFTKQQITLSQCNKISADYEQKIVEAKLEQQKLEEELGQTETDEYLERMARERLGLVKSNERVFVDVTNE